MGDIISYQYKNERLTEREMECLQVFMIDTIVPNNEILKIFILLSG